VSDSTESTSDKTVSTGTSGESDAVDVSILDVFLMVSANFRLLLFGLIVGAVSGILVAMMIPDQFTAEATVVPESSSDVPQLGGLSALGGLGMNLGLSGISGGLGPEAYTTVLRSREVHLAVAGETFDFAEEGEMSVIEYVSLEDTALDLVIKYTVRLPFTIKENLTSESDSLSLMRSRNDKAIRFLRERVSGSLEDDSGLMVISSTTSSPQLSADLVDAYVGRLSDRVQEIRTEKVRQRVAFVESQLSEAERELRVAEERLAAFLEQNQNPTTATLRFERDRLQRQVGFKEQLYSDILQQYTQSKLDLQRQQPVVTVVERASPPLEPSSIGTLTFLLIGMLAGLTFAVVMVLSRVYVSRIDPAERAKVEAIQSSLPSWIRQRFT